jgi:hypothetical protein
MVRAIVETQIELREKTPASQTAQRPMNAGLDPSLERFNSDLAGRPDLLVGAPRRHSI